MEGSGEAAVDLTVDEAEQYDRQIRLWGLEAQKRYKFNVGSIFSRLEIFCFFL